tara:strand:+ start:966 stop:1928 length:963 start_codon:yes stop_codon:yes gene_type:complete
MKAIRIENPGKDSQLEICTIDPPSIKACEVLIKVHSFALNHADLLQRHGKYPPPKGTTEIPGLELAGEIVQIGDQTQGYQIGDKVYALVSGGAYAEYCSAHFKLIHKIPSFMDFDTACAIPEALLTVHATVFEMGQLKNKERLLLHGAGSGITSMACQMAKVINAEVISTIGKETKRQQARSLGIDHIYNYHKTWHEHIEKDSVHTIVDFVGGDYFDTHLKLLAPKGKLIQIACMNGHRVQTSLLPIITKQIMIQGFVLRPQSLRQKTKLWEKAHQKWFNHIESQQIKPVIDSIFTFSQIEEAHLRMLTSQHFGKIIIKI